MRRRLSHAEELLQSYGITEPQDIDLETLAHCLDIDIEEEPLDGCEALIVGNGNKASIIVNSKSSWERQRFSIGHELGHWHYHKGQHSICRSDDIGNFSSIGKEKAADDFASELLMPGYMFSPLARRCEHTCFKNILEFKDMFTTSITATALRLVEFSPEPCILVCYDRNGNRLWFKRNRDVPDRLFPNARLDSDTIAYDVLNKKQSNSYPSQIPAEAWFEGDGLSRYQVYEETIPVDNGKILTLLTWRSEIMFERLYGYG